MKRSFDLILALVACVILLIPFLVLSISIKLTSEGNIIFWSDRIGRYNKIFSMPKFRSMKIDTPAVATHLLPDPENSITKIGSFLRRTSLDELPQLWCIMKGDMSFVGPRPALFNQDDLIELRTQHGIHNIIPGLTGWAQINGRDEVSIEDKVKLDIEYLRRKSFWFDLYILWKTFKKVVIRDDVSH